MVGRMVAEVEQLDPGLLRARRRGAASSRARSSRIALAPPGLGDPAACEAFDKSLDGRALAARRLQRARTRGDRRCRAPRARPRGSRRRRGPRRWRSTRRKNPYRLETLNVSAHAPLMRTLAHAHYTFRKKLSHTADSQDQRHRTVPGSRPLLSRTVPRRRRRRRARADPRRPRLSRALPGGGGGGLGRARAAARAGRRRRSSRSTCCPTRWPSASRSPARCSICSTSGPCAPA